MAPDVRRAFERALLAVLLVSFVPRPAHALRFCNWNILNWPGTASTAAVREPAFRTVLADIHPDVLVVQEMQSQAGVNQFLTNVLNVNDPGQWTAVTFHFHGDTDNAMFYKPAKVVMVDSTYLTTDLRDIAVYRFRMAGYTGPAAEISAFSMHLKASSGTANEHQRRIEAIVARNYANNLPSGTNFFYCGDMNVYSNSDSGYVIFLQSQADNDGRAHDPLNRQGFWNNSSFADVHTQSTRTGTLTPSDGGATGGLDDRFDQLLFSPTMDDGQGLDWLPGSYKPWGNDGAHYNLNINDPPTNAAVGQTVANALQRTSDHLPVVVDFQAPALAGVSPASLDFGTVIVGAPSPSQDVSVSDVAAAPADELDFTIGVPAGFSAAPGPYQVAVGAGAQLVGVSLDTSTPGNAAGNLTVASDDPENPVQGVPLSGTILAHASPSLATEPTTLARDIDWGVQVEGGFDVRRFAVYDAGYSALQAQLELGTATVTGGDGRFTLEAPAGDPVLVAGDSVEFAVAFHDSGATADSLYEATVTIPTKDPSGIPGGTDLASLTVTLHATLGASPVATPVELPARTGIRLAGSHPARGGLRLGFDLAHDAEVRVELFDVSGRKVGTLASGFRAAGRYQLGWSAPRGASRAGVYFVSYEADGVRGVERVVILP